MIFNKNLRVKHLLGTLIILLFGCGLFVVPTPSKAQLCEDLAPFIDNHDCNNEDYIHSILDAAFVPGETKREDIRIALDSYFIETSENNETTPIWAEADVYSLGGWKGMNAVFPNNRLWVYYVWVDEDGYFKSVDSD